MMKDLYYVQTNGYDMLISDDGEARRVLTDSSEADLSSAYDKYHDIFEAGGGWMFSNDWCADWDIPWETVQKVLCLRFLIDEVEDDSSWEEHSETVEELVEDCEILAVITKEL